ncbi:hypothetical protein FQV07_0010013, partial [Pygoscelis papua]
SVIAVFGGGPWGDWAWLEMCPKCSYASGINFKVEAPQGVMEDDTALSGIRLCCSRSRGLHSLLLPHPLASAPTISSPPSRWGRWSEVAHLVGFALRVKAPQRGLLSNEVATTSARFACSDGHVLEGPGSTWGQWGGWSARCPRAVCGIETRQDPARGLKRDDTALNDLNELFCC